MAKKTLSQLNILVIMVLLCLAVSAGAMTRIQDIARPSGERGNVLVGTGLVTGLNGTGDGDLEMTANAVRSWLRKAGNPVESYDSVKNMKNVAFVTVTVDLSRNGITDGDQIDVTVSSLGKASSLEGGILFATPLTPLHDQDNTVYAWAQGKIALPDPRHATVGVIRGGATVEIPHFHSYIQQESGSGRFYFDLILDESFASFQVAQALIVEINAMNALPGGDSNPDFVEVEDTAKALDAKTIRVYIPAKQVDKYPSYIARIMNLPIELPESEAVVVINERSGTMSFGGNVEILPCVITVDGMLITIVEPEVIPDPQQPQMRESAYASFDSAGTRQAQLSDLIKALDQLKVPFYKKVAAVYQLQKGSWLKARIVSE